MIAIVDYGLANLRSVQKGFERVGANDAEIVRSPEAVRRAEKVVLPGVGAFGDAMALIRERGFVEPLVEAARSGRPFLGICLGLQLLFDVSTEGGECEGFGLVPGRVERFDFRNRVEPQRHKGEVEHGGTENAEKTWNRRDAEDAETMADLKSQISESAIRNPQSAILKVPHMGWNQMTWERDCPLLRGLESGTHFYFVHSYYVKPENRDVICGTCDYGGPFTAMIWRDNLYATQFHPEKSQQGGLTILKNFASL